MTADLARKLGLRPGLRGCLLSGPQPARRAIRQAGGPGILWVTRLGKGPYDLIFFWPVRLRGLASEFLRFQRRLAPSGALWVVMPKKAHAERRGIVFAWEAMQAEGLKGDLVDNKIASITETDYGTRFVIRRDRRRAPG